MSSVLCSSASGSRVPAVEEELFGRRGPMRLFLLVGFDRDSYVGSWHLAVNLRVVRPVAVKFFRAREASSEG